MNEEDKIDFGSVHIHKRAIADIALTTINDIDGVSLTPKEFIDKALEFFGKKNYSGIKVTMDRDGQVGLAVGICVRYGLNIPEIANQVQDAIKLAVERMADIHLREVNVNIQGIERQKEK